MQKYIIGSGYAHNPDDKEDKKFKLNFFNIWYKNTLKYTNPQKITILNSGINDLPLKNNKIEWINVNDNPGHVHHHMGKKNKNSSIKWNNSPFFCGWTYSFIFGAMYAYSLNCDFIYKEQDCLAFGNWIDILYASLGNKKMITGECKHMPVEQSIFLIKKEYIPEFLYLYTSISKPDYRNLPEWKFFNLIKNNNDMGYFDLQYGRNRPIDYTKETFYVQQIDKSILQKLKQYNKI